MSIYRVTARSHAGVYDFDTALMNNAGIVNISNGSFGDTKKLEPVRIGDCIAVRYNHCIYPFLIIGKIELNLTDKYLSMLNQNASATKGFGDQFLTDAKYWQDKNSLRIGLEDGTFYVGILPQVLMLGTIADYLKTPEELTGMDNSGKPDGLTGANALKPFGIYSEEDARANLKDWETEEIDKIMKAFAEEYGFPYNGKD